MRSVASRIDGRGGKMYVPRAMYSFRMSFWVVPPTRSAGTPCRLAMATYIASRIAAKARIRVDAIEDRRERRTVCRLELRALDDTLGRFCVFRPLPFVAVAAPLRHGPMVPT